MVKPKLEKNRAFLPPFAAFLLTVSAPEHIARDGNVSFAKTGGFVETVPISALTANRKSKPQWAAFSLVRFFVAVDKEMNLRMSDEA